MRLSATARYFDTCPAYDGYSGSRLFNLQASTFLESAAEGSTGARRVVSVASNVTPPAHSSLLILDELWLTGAVNKDEWAGSTIRKTYWTRRVTDLFRILTPGEACLSATGTLAHGSKRFNKEVINNPTDAESDALWDCYLSHSLAVPRGYFLRSNTTLYRVDVEFKDLDGFLTCRCDQLDEGPVSAMFTTTPGYDPVTDSYTPTSVAANVIVMDYWKVFRRLTQADAAAYSGDVVVFIPKSQVAVAHSQKFSIATGKHTGSWQVMATVDTGFDAWQVHARRA